MSQAPGPWHDLSGQDSPLDAEEAKLRRWKALAAEPARRTFDPFWPLVAAAVAAVGVAVCFAVGV